MSSITIHLPIDGFNPIHQEISLYQSAILEALQNTESHDGLRLEQAHLLALLNLIQAFEKAQSSEAERLSAQGGCHDK